MSPQHHSHHPHEDEAVGRRAQLLARRRRHARLGIVATVSALVAATTALGVYVYSSASSPAKAASASANDPSTLRPGLPDVAAETVATRPLDHTHPLRLWVGGDSLAGLLGPALGDLVGATGVVTTRVDYKVSSGLWGNDVRNWQDRATAQMQDDNPEAIVFMIGANDTGVVNKVDANHDGVPDWQVDYRAKLSRMMDTFVGDAHRTVFWLGSPTLGTNENKAAQELDDVMRDEVSKHPGVIYVDTYRLFEGPHGGYSKQIVDENGKEITARIGDGVHFTDEGANYLARQVFGLLDKRFRLSAQADTADPIGWNFASGDAEVVPGQNSQPRSRYGSGSGSSTTHRTYSGGSSGGSGTTSYSPPTSPKTTPATSPATSPKTTPNT